MANPTLDKCDKDVQFIAFVLNQYSTFKKQQYGTELNYILDIKSDSEDENSEDPKIGESKIEDSEQQKEANSDDESYSDTESEYDNMNIEDEFAESVNKTMAVAIIDMNRSIVDKGVEITNIISEHIVFVDKHEKVCSEYMKKIRSTSEVSDEMNEMDDIEFDKIYSQNLENNELNDRSDNSEIPPLLSANNNVNLTDPNLTEL